MLTVRETTVARKRLRLRLRFFSASVASKPKSSLVSQEVRTALRVSFTSRDWRIAAMGAIFAARLAGIQAEIKMVSIENKMAMTIARGDTIRRS